MSYARFGWDDSDVYVFATNYEGADGWECCGCGMYEESFYTHLISVMIDHLKQHRERGHTVPQYAVDRLIAERDGIPYPLHPPQGATK